MKRLREVLLDQKKNLYIKKNYKPKDFNYQIYNFNKCIFILDLFSMFLILSFLSYGFYNNLLLTILIFPLFPFYYKFKCRNRVNKSQRLLRLAFKDTIQVINSFLQSGNSFENAMRKSYKEMKDTEYENDCLLKNMEFMIMQLDIGCSVEDVWNNFSIKSGVADVKYFADVLRIVQRSGGEVSKIIQSSVYQISLQIQIEEEIETMIQGKKIELTIMEVMPILILIYIGFSVPDMMYVMYHTLAGIVIMTVCLGFYIIGCLLGNKIISIKV